MSDNTCQQCNVGGDSCTECVVGCEVCDQCNTCQGCDGGCQSCEGCDNCNSCDTCEGENPGCVGCDASCQSCEGRYVCDADEWDGKSCEAWDTNCGSGQDPEYCGSCDSDGDTCTGCDSACYSGETCSNCNSGDSCISCNVACYAEENCDACDTGCQNGENCTNCNSACESCNVCDGCDTYCDNSCEGCQDCQSSCEECNDCQTGCQVSCETGCEVNCEETCESSCESACEGDCQTVCQTSCQSLNTCDNKNSCSGGQTCNTCDSSDAPIVPDTFTIAFDYINRKDGSILADRTTSTAEEGSFVIPEPASRVLTKDEKDYVLLDSTNAIIEGLGVYSVGDTIQLTSSIATDGVIVIKYQYRSTQSIKTGWLTTHDGTRFAPKTAVSQMEGVLPIEKGGTGATNAVTALKNLGGVTAEEVNTSIDDKVVSLKLAKIASGEYRGTGNTNQTINIGFRPKILIINREFILGVSDDFVHSVVINDNGFTFDGNTYNEWNENYTYIAVG